ncbi:MAG: hypothetical protein KatS3mg076_0314 [Candidatus Binatia bacterium]|nr:MAG: hypothetical protein KatS3mg076_0314 [Candidatus Binatia bacterium]
MLTLAPAAFEVEGRAERSGQELCLGGGARARAPLYVSRRGVRFTVFFRSSQEARSFAVRWDGRILGHGDPGGQDGSQWTFQVRAGRGTHVLDLEPRGQGRLLCLEKVAVTQF